MAVDVTENGPLMLPPIPSRLAHVERAPFAFASAELNSPFVPPHDSGPNGLEFAIPTLANVVEVWLTPVQPLLGVTLAKTELPIAGTHPATAAIPQTKRTDRPIK